MTTRFRLLRRWQIWLFLLAAGAGLPSGDSLEAQPAKDKALRIGNTASLGAEAQVKDRKAVRKELQRFIREETGLHNEVIEQKDWRELGEALAKGRLDVGVLQGFEFAWAQAKYSTLRPLALAVNGQRYSAAYLMVPKDSKAADFAGLRGKSLAIPVPGQGLTRLFVERQCQAAEEKLDKFFSSVASPEFVEDALDDLVDDKYAAVAVDRAGLDAYRRRKPFRADRLKELLHSGPIPRAVVAYAEGGLDAATQQRFRQGLLDAGRKKSGETLLAMFKLTGFEPIPTDFDKVIAEVRKEYPVE
jgi:ABC-type phosphate/phosphonate transport system substrate-binding protein